MAFCFYIYTKYGYILALVIDRVSELITQFLSIQQQLLYQYKFDFDNCIPIFMQNLSIKYYIMAKAFIVNIVNVSLYLAFFLKFASAQFN